MFEIIQNEQSCCLPELTCLSQSYIIEVQAHKPTALLVEKWLTPTHWQLTLTLRVSVCYIIM
jgi:hypothetical protein